MSDNKSPIFEVAIEGIQAFGELGASVIQGITDLGTSAVNGVTSAVNGIVDRWQQTKLKALDNQLIYMNNQHERAMQKIQNEHELALLSERNRHEEYILSEQRAVIEKMIDTAKHAYDRKLDFITEQQACLSNTYNKERDLIAEHIRFLEGERSKVINDPTQYAQISTDLSKLEDSKSKMYLEYMKARGSLDDAIKMLEIQSSFGASLGGVLENASFGNSYLPIGESK